MEGLCQAGEIGSQRMHKGGVWALDQQAKIGGVWYSLLMHQLEVFVRTRSCIGQTSMIEEELSLFVAIGTTRY